MIRCQSSKTKIKYLHGAKSSVEALLEKGYLTGTSSTTIGPKDNTTRAQSVTLLSRLNK